MKKQLASRLANSMKRACFRQKNSLLRKMLHDIRKNIRIKKSQSQRVTLTKWRCSRQKGSPFFAKRRTIIFSKGSVLFNGKNCFSCASCKMVPLIQIHANHYNPNKVAEPELELLELSIREDGFTQPLVCYFDNEKKGTY